MQNQLTPGQSTLQQSTSNLQPNSSNIQQSGTPTGSSNVFTVLSQDSQVNTLQVQSAQTDPSAPSQTYQPSISAATWVVPLAFIAAIIVALILLARLRDTAPEVTAVEPEPAPEPMPTTTPKKKKTTKKASRRKRQANR